MISPCSLGALSFGRIGRPRSTNGRDLLAPAHSPAQVARDLRLPAHLGTTRRRSGGRAVSPPSCFVFRPSAPSGAAAPRVPPTGPPAVSLLLLLPRSIDAYYLLTYFLLPIFLRRCEESQPAATGEQARGLRSSICRLHNEWWLLLLLWRANMTMQLAGFSLRLPAYSFLFFLLPGVNVFSVES